MFSHTKSTGVKTLNMSVSLHCTLTLKRRITWGIIRVYVCVSVYPFIPSSCSLSLPHINRPLHANNTNTDMTALSNGSSQPLVWAWQTKVQLMSNNVFISVTLFLLSAHSCRCCFIPPWFQMQHRGDKIWTKCTTLMPAQSVCVFMFCTVAGEHRHSA